MTTALAKTDAASLLDMSRASEEAAAQGDLRSRVRYLCSACRQVFGMPDYDRYLAHAAARHPGAPILSRRNFCARAIERKYGKSGPRCC